MTIARRITRARCRCSSVSRSLVRPRTLLSGALASSALLSANSLSLEAQRSGNAPVAPASAIGTATTDPTFSVLGLASTTEGGGLGLTQRVWLGATQPLGRVANVRFSAIASGDLRGRDAVGSSSAGEGLLALRARARFSGAQVWSAISYGYVNVNGGLPGQRVGLMPVFGTGLDGARVDTTVSRRVDVGSIQRAEAGVISRMSGVEFSLGFSVERASRVTTRTLTIDESNLALPLQMTLADRFVTTRSTRSVQRRDLATGIASMGFNTGPTTWLVSMTSPVASWISSDALAPKPRVAPTIVSIALVQPLTAWLSVVGAAATNSASVGSTALRDDLGAGRNRNFAPIVALGVRVAGLPFFGRPDDTPGGILSIETRTIGSVGSATVQMTTAAAAGDSSTTAEHDTLRVVLLIDAPKAESVELMGDATQWTVTRMIRDRNGRWRAELKLAPGVHRITVRADGGKWIAPPNLPIANDDYGSPVGMIVVPRGR